MLTLASDIFYPCKMTLKDPTYRDPLGAGAYFSRRRWSKPKAHFMLSLPADSLAEAQRLFAFYTMVRGDNAFWFDGGTHGVITTPQVFWLGDGVTSNFMLPFCNIYAPTWKIYVNETVNPNWTAVESSGLFAFTAPPEEGEIAGMGQRIFKVQFWGNDEDAFSQTEFFDGLFEEGIELREVP